MGFDLLRRVLLSDDRRVNLHLEYLISCFVILTSGGRDNNTRMRLDLVNFMLVVKLLEVKSVLSLNLLGNKISLRKRSRSKRRRLYKIYRICSWILLICFR
jgi:hypothetical protein